jgi:hypothetical protein
MVLHAIWNCENQTAVEFLGEILKDDRNRLNASKMDF